MQRVIIFQNVIFREEMFFFKVYCLIKVLIMVNELLRYLINVCINCEFSFVLVFVYDIIYENKIIYVKYINKLVQVINYVYNYIQMMKS